MLKIKRLHTFILQTYLPMFFMTFFICLFILLMHFLWRRLDDLVGKGLGVDVIGEMFFYAAITMVPMALPLAILLASLMTFGNLGEHSELTAMKASGVSLLNVMKPLIAFIAVVSVGAFFFQNEVLPRAQVKMWTLVFSVRQKSPDLDIPEGAFYDQISGYNVFVRNKDKERGTLYDMMIYDVSKGNGYASIILADSGKLSFNESKTHLKLHLFQGETFEDMRSGSGNSLSDEGKLYRRESFADKQVLIPFDANFNKLDEQTMRSQYIGKNIAELQHPIDSVSLRLDSISSGMMSTFRTEPVVGVPYMKYEMRDTARVAKVVELPEVRRPLNFDSLYRALKPDDRVALLNRALNRASQAQHEFLFRGAEVSDDVMVIRRHEIEMIKKYTLSLACLIFFFIGAPLGAIIRKGGLGMPIVISVILFIIYYMIDSFGYKQARDGRFDVLFGICLSSLMLFPLGVFLTYKAMNDSAVFNPDAYRKLLRRLVGVQEARKLEKKEVIIDEVETSEALAMLRNLIAEAEALLARYPHRQLFLTYFIKGFDRAQLGQLIAHVEEVVDYLGNSRSQLVLNKAMDYPIINNSRIYSPNLGKRYGTIAAAIIPISLPVYFIGASSQKTLLNDVKNVKVVSEKIIEILTDSNE